MFHKFRISLRKQTRKRRKQVTRSAVNFGDDFEKYFIQRLGRFNKNWRTVSAWLLLMLLIIGCLVVQLQALSRYYQSRQPIPGGIYTEGVLCTFTNANPIYATSDADKTVSRLIFSGLLKYDDQNNLVGDLAESWSMNTTGTVYTMKLRPNLTWQDGHPLTADDVVFTYRVIQNPDAASPLQGSWQGITVTAKDARTVTFTLPNPLSSFMYNVTTGIVPKHLLGKVPMVGMRSVAFNTQSPVGAGPFVWKNIEVNASKPETAEESIGLSPFEHYWDSEAKLKSFVVHAYTSRAAMIDAYQQGNLTAMSGLDTMPSGLPDNTQVQRFSLTAETMTFFNTSTGPLADATLRKALVQAADPSKVIKAIGHSPKPVNEPLLIGQLGYDAQFAQKTRDLAAAKQTLDAAGWTGGANGIRTKDGKPLTFTLSYNEKPEYTKVVRTLVPIWKELGVDVKTDPEDDNSFRTLFSSFNPDGTHTYDAVLYGIAIGVDPDVFAYWHSSQADIRSKSHLNFSDYKSAVADEALEAGRTRNNPQLRAIKYQAFLRQWQQDTPALGLYQPQYLYISRVPVYGLNNRTMNDGADRIYSAHDWMIRTARVTND